MRGASPCSCRSARDAADACRPATPLTRVGARVSARLRAMKRLVFAAFAATVLGCGSTRGPELGEGPCSNGLDDDGDMLTDCADPACALFSWCSEGDAGTRDAGRDANDLDARLDAGDAGPPICSEPLDVVLVLDVSSSMTEDLARLRDLAPALWAAAMDASTEARISLVVFVDDALAVDACAPLSDAGALATELDQWRAFTTSNRSPVSEITNVDCPENSLDAIAAAVTGCPWRDGSRVILHVTDDTFVERPAVLSGPFGPGVIVASTYLEVSDALAREGIELLALTANGPGQDCGGPSISADVGRGFHTPFGTDVPLPERSGGEAWDLRAMRDGTFELVPGFAAHLSRTACAP
jgi:hypothetical protein